MPDTDRRGPDRKPSRRQLEAACLELINRYSHQRQFNGASIGYKWKDGSKTRDLVVRAHVSRKLPAAELEPSLQFPATVDEVPVDVVARVYEPRQETEFRPSQHKTALPAIMSGASCSRADGRSGSMGLIVLREKDRQIGLLSSFQVLGGAHAQRGDPIFHPGLTDVPTHRAAMIAELEDWLPDADAAFAVLAPDEPWLPTQLGSFLPIAKTRSSRLGERLLRSCCSSDPVTATVEGEGYFRVLGAGASGQQDRFVEGFELHSEASPTDAMITNPGDIGAVWMSPNDHAAVGLQIAAETHHMGHATHAIAVNVETVLDRMGLKVATYEDWLQQPQRRSPPRALRSVAAMDEYEMPIGAGRAQVESTAAQPKSPVAIMFLKLRKALVKRGLAGPGLSIANSVDVLTVGPVSPHAAIAETTRQRRCIPNVNTNEISHLNFFYEICEYLVEKENKEEER